LKQREFITLLGGAAAAWLLAARAQQGDRMRRIGFLVHLAENDPEGQACLTALVQRLKELGWTNDRNVRLDIRWGAGDAERYRQYALELVALAPDVLLANTSPVLAALQRATRTVPIVFVGVSWPLSDRAATTRDAAASLNASALYRLMAWLSPAYPIGAFSYSSGIEWAVEAGDITDAVSLEGWLATMIAGGSGFCDAVFFAHAHRAVTQSDEGALRAVAELAAAFAPSKERHLETMAQGRAFLDVTRAAWPTPALDSLLAICNGGIALPVAVGVASAGHGIALAPSLQAYLQAFAANLVSAGVRLIPLGQTDGQRVLAALEPVVRASAERAIGTALEEVGGAAFRADIAGMRHETQHTRLFRS